MDPDNTTTVSSSCCVAVRRDESVNSNLNFPPNVSSCNTYWEHLIVQLLHIVVFFQFTLTRMICTYTNLETDDACANIAIVRDQN